MDEKTHLILTRGKDRTYQIESYNVTDSFISITYKNSPTTYKYATHDVMILDNPRIFDISAEQVIYHDNIPVNNVRQIIDFGVKLRVRLNNGASQIYDAESIRIDSNGVRTTSAKNILKLWSDIARYTSIDGDWKHTDTFLQQQFNQLKFVSPASVLSSYLNGDPVSVSPRTNVDMIFPFKFNLSQKGALDNALRSQISIIEGPPGTGKTQTILNTLASLVMQNKSVAVVSNSNAAIQNVQDKLASEGYNFLVAALGNKEHRERFFSNPPGYDGVSDWKSDSKEGVLLSQIKELNGRIHDLMNIERDKAQLQRRLSAYELEQEHFESYYSTQDVEEIRRLSLYALTPERILSLLSGHRIAVQRGKAESLAHKMKLIFRYGFISLKRMKSQEMDVILSFQRKYYELKVGQVKQRIEAMQRALDGHSFDMLLNQHQTNSKELFRHKLHQKYARLERVHYSPSNYKKAFGKFINQYPIMLSTTHSLRTCIPENFLFDYIIIDESSQVDLLTGALALSCGKNVIIVGDTKQLPQIVDTRIQRKIHMDDSLVGGAYDYFRHNLLSSMFALFGDSVPKAMLQEHYRCHPKIIEFCNQKYYDGQVIPFTVETENDSPLLIYRTAQGNHMRDVVHGQKGKFNQRELDVIEHEVLVNLASAIRNHTDIGFTTPYRKQVEKAVDQLDGDIEIDTIHKYQGREKPIMVLSTVLDSSRAGRKGLKFVDDPCMINVAVSRAQKMFILVTDHAFLRDYGSEIGDLIRYMEYNTLDDNIMDSGIVSVFDLLYKDYSDKLNALQRRTKRRSTYASENIMWTLLEAILQDPNYEGIGFRSQVFVRNLLKDMNRLAQAERRFVNNGASVDFVLYHKFDKSPVLAIEVDGFAFHENNPRQLKRDRLKDQIFDTYGLPLLRLSTTGSDEERRIRMKLDGILKP